MRLRISASHSPLQSPRSAIISSIFLDALKRPDDSSADSRDSLAFKDFLEDVASVSSLQRATRTADMTGKEWECQTLVGLSGR